MYTDYKPKHKTQTNGIPIYSCQGKHIGDVIGNEWRKEIVTSWMLTTPAAIANDVQALHDAMRAGAEYVVITNTETGIIFRASIAKIFDKGVRMNRGYGNQIYLVLSDFLQSRDPAFIQAETPATEPTESTATDEVKELKYTSHMPTGSKFTNTGKQTPKQISMFGSAKNDHYR
jgi:hypothetical protein